MKKNTKFKEWLKIREDIGRDRRGSGDLINVGLGKLGPYAQFGDPDRPGQSIPQRAVGHVVQGFGSKMRELLGPIEAAPYIHGLDFSKFERTAMASQSLPLQLPRIDNQELNISIPSYSDERAVEKVMALIPNPSNDTRIRYQFEQGKGKFDLYNPEEKNEDLSLLGLATKFTTALQKLILYSEFSKRPDFENLQTAYNMKNPKIISQRVEVSRNVHFLVTVFQYERKKTYSQNYDFYSQEG